MMSQTQSLTFTEERIIDVARDYNNRRQINISWKRSSPTVTEKCLQDYSHRIIFYILCNDESNAEFNFH